MRLYLAAAVIAAAALGLAAPAAASAATHHAAVPASAAFHRPPAAAATAVGVAPRLTTTAATNCTFNTIVARPNCRQYRLAAPYSDCYIEVGDYARADMHAQGAAWAGCTSHKYLWSMLLWLDYVDPNTGKFVRIEQNFDEAVVGPSYGENIVTNGAACGGSKVYWQTFARLSINRSNYSTQKFVSIYAPFQAGPC